MVWRPPSPTLNRERRGKELVRVESLTRGGQKEDTFSGDHVEHTTIGDSLLPAGSAKPGATEFLDRETYTYTGKDTQPSLTLGPYHILIRHGFTRSYCQSSCAAAMWK